MTRQARVRAREIAMSAPAPDPETIARLRALLGVMPAGSHVGRAA